MTTVVHIPLSEQIPEIIELQKQLRQAIFDMANTEECVTQLLNHVSHMIFEFAKSHEDIPGTYLFLIASLASSFIYSNAHPTFREPVFAAFLKQLQDVWDHGRNILDKDESIQHILDIRDALEEKENGEKVH